MNRKNTILLAVLINAGLLLVLFVTALSSKDEVQVAEVNPKAVPQESAPAPLFGGEELDLALKPHAAPAETPAVQTESQPAPVMHALPPMAVEPTPTPLVIQAPALNPAPTSSVREVVVKKGDSLEKIAKVNHTSVEELIKFNHLSSSFLRVGQLIKIPQAGAAKPASKPIAAAETKGADYYVVKVGDTPWTIAMKHHLKVDELLKLNNLNEEKAKRLKAGDRLRIR